MHERETQDFLVKHSVWTRDCKYVCVCLDMHKCVWEREKDKVLLYCGEMQNYQESWQAGSSMHSAVLSLHFLHKTDQCTGSIIFHILFKTLKTGGLINQTVLPTKILIWMWHIYLSSMLSSSKMRMTPKYYANSIFSYSFWIYFWWNKPRLWKKNRITIYPHVDDMAKSCYICQQKLFSYS